MSHHLADYSNESTCNHESPELIDFKWEQLDSVTFRVKVFGGWIVNRMCEIHTNSMESGRMITDSMVFIPDPNHLWKVK